MTFQSARSYSPKTPAIAALIGIGALGITTAFMLKPGLGGKAPSQPAVTSATDSPAHGGHQSTSTLPPELEEFKQASEKDPTLLKPYLAKLDESYHKSASDNPAVTFAYVAALQKQREIEPRDTDAIYALANISFDNRVFSKAISYFAEYLAIKPDDLSTRARYASALSFTGEFDKALIELESILERDPKHFSALAYKAITLAQKDDVKGAKQIGAIAVDNAPNEEAKQRIVSFLASLDKDKTDLPSSHPPLESPSNASTNLGPDMPLDSYFKSHPIVGAKLVELTRNGTVASLNLKDFPMAAMPPFAKEKFFSSVKEAAKTEPEVKKIEFRDVVSNQVMDSIEVN